MKINVLQWRIIGDLLREVLVNENSENSCVFSESDKSELIYAIFKIFAVGGSLCQPETTIARYLEMTKAFYKDILTVYKDSKTNDIKVSGRAYRIKSVDGLTMFPGKSHYLQLPWFMSNNLQLPLFSNDFPPFDESLMSTLFFLLFSGTFFSSEEENMHNELILLIDPMKKYVTAIKNTYRPYW